MATNANTSVGAITILPATHKLVNVSATKGGLARTVQNHVRLVSTDWVARRNVRISCMAIRPVITSAGTTSAVRDTLELPASIPAARTDTGCIAARIARVKMGPNATTSADRVNVHLAGWEPTVTFLAGTLYLYFIHELKT